VRYVVADFETASRADLQKIGAWKYAADMSTFPLCLGLKVVTDKRPAPTFVLSEKQMHALDPRLMELCNDPEVIFVAHNAGFEQAMWKFHMVPMGYPELPPERWHDTMAVAGMKGLPLGLDALVTALELPVKKDMDGHRHMLIMCKPDRYGGWSQHNEHNLKILYDYCASDCDAQYGVYVTTQGLGPAERHTWIVDQRYNQRGIKIDTEFVNACIEVLDKVRVPMTERFRELTGLNPTQREKVLNWVNDNGVPLGDMKKATLDAILDPGDEFGIEDFQEPLPYHVHEVITLRRSLASSSVAKLERMLQCASATDMRVRYATQFHGARTGRDVGRLIQVQNYPRGEISDRQGLTADILADAILTRDIDYIQELWGPDIFSAIISSLRSCIVPEKGKVIVSGDYAAVEARNLLSMAGQHDRVEQMHAGLDVYSETASMIYKRPIDRKVQQKEGQIGKNTFLGSGYGLGPVGFRARFAPKESIDLAMLAINTYRKEVAPMVPKFWYGLWQASVDAVWCDHAKTYSYAGIEFRKENDFLTMRLPDGKKLWYHRPRKDKTFNPNTGQEHPSWTFMSYQGKKFRRHLAWHGMITADCIQGSARQLMVGAMKRAEKAGLFGIFKVHDELVFEETDRPDLIQMVTQIMEDVEPWAIERKFRVKANVESMLRYRK